MPLLLPVENGELVTLLLIVRLKVSRLAGSLQEIFLAVTAGEDIGLPARRRDELAALHRKHPITPSVATLELDSQLPERVAQGSPHKCRTSRPEQLNSHVSRVHDFFIKSQVNCSQFLLQCKSQVLGFY